MVSAIVTSSGFGVPTSPGVPKALADLTLTLTYNDFDGATKLFEECGGDIAGLIVEPVVGNANLLPPREGYLQHLRELCTQHGALLIFDEVMTGFLQAVRALCDRHDALLVLDEIQCGMGRSGVLFAHWQDGVVPDIVTLAKALGGGMPIGAMLAGPKVAEVMQFGAHGTTFGGNPLASAVARVALRTLASDDIAANVQRQAQAIRDGLDAINRDLDLFTEVRGRGLMIGAVLKPGYAGRAGEILDHAAANGLLLLQAGPDVLRFVPALNIGDEDVGEGLARLRLALEAFVAG